MASIIWLTLTTLCLLLLVEMLSMAPCWLLPLPVLLLASPLWFALREAFLFQRRLLLSGATLEGCFTRRVLWGGSLGSALQVIPALVFSLLLLALGARLTALEWTLLFADAGGARRPESPLPTAVPESGPPRDGGGVRAPLAPSAQ